jgi:hypothetical protein
MEFSAMIDVGSLPFREQFEAAVVVSGVCLAAAVTLREYFTDREIRIAARVLGLAGWAVVVTFAWRMTLTNETLAMQVAQKPVKANPITEQYLSVAHFKTPKGRNILMEFDHARGESSVCYFSGCLGSGTTGVSAIADSVRRDLGCPSHCRSVDSGSTGSPSKLLARKPDESIHADDGPEQF